MSAVNILFQYTKFKKKSHDSWSSEMYREIFIAFSKVWKRRGINDYSWKYRFYELARRKNVGKSYIVVTRINKLIDVSERKKKQIINTAGSFDMVYTTMAVWRYCRCEFKEKRI